MKRALFICTFPFALFACAPTTGGTDAGPTGPEAQCTDPVDPPCQDEAFQQLDLFTNKTDGIVEDEQGGPVFASHVDATAGGFNNINESYNYVRFTDDGLEKVDLDDEEAFASMDWDMAFQRFIVRLNSGVSGPSCVTAARTAAGIEFNDIDAPPEGLTYHAEEYFDEDADCALVADGSGLGSPGVVLQNYWEYPGCVKMTGNVYVVQLASGRHIKLQVTGYYDDQDTCDQGGTFGSGSGNMRFKWAWLD